MESERVHSPQDGRSQATAATVTNDHRDFRAFPGLSMIAGLNVAGVLLIVRRAGGGAIHGLTGFRIVIAAVVIAGLALVAREILHRTSRGNHSGAGRLWIGIFCALPLWALTFTLASWRFAAATGSVAALATSTGLAAFFWSSWRQRGQSDNPAVRTHVTDAPRNEAASDRFDTAASLSAPIESYDEAEQLDLEMDDDSLMSLDGDGHRSNVSRLITPDGIDRMTGRTFAEFLPGQKFTSVHIAFCPPFARTPTLESATDAPGVRINVAAVYAYGARLELKRSQGLADGLQADIEFEALLRPCVPAAA